nr:hypothetical protein Q903MT_gene1306 [Picea sitchensis]
MPYVPSHKSFSCSTFLHMRKCEWGHEVSNLLYTIVFSAPKALHNNSTHIRPPSIIINY